MKLYHGSNMRVEKPDLQRSKPFKDFGQGFYLSDNYKQAEDLAIVKVEQMRRGRLLLMSLILMSPCCLLVNCL